METTNLATLSIEKLQEMYAHAASQLKEALLNGTPWEAVKEYRRDVTELQIALYNKVRSGDLNPAENENRASTEPEPS